MVNSWQTYSRTTEFQFKPSNFLLDFEEALRNSIKNAFPSAAICADFFHFMQCNIRWLEQHGGKEYVKEMVPMLRTVFYSVSANELQNNIDLYNKILERTISTLLCLFYW